MASRGEWKVGKREENKCQSSEGCHCWHTDTRMSMPRWGAARAPPGAPTWCLHVLAPSPHHGARLPWRAVWLAYWTCHHVTLPWRRQLNSNANNARETGEGHQSPLSRQGCSLVLSPCHVPLRLQRHSCLIHHHRRHVLLTKMENPTQGSFLTKSLPR